jgi:hypothetical protein
MSGSTTTRSMAPIQTDPVTLAGAEAEIEQEEAIPSSHLPTGYEYQTNLTQDCGDRRQSGLDLL